MTWVRLDDTAPLHPKLLQLSDGAFRLWVHGLAFANRGATDGRIEKSLVPSLNHQGKWTKNQMKILITELLSGLWIDRGDHYEIHHYAHHQAEALKDRVERKRAYEREKKRKQREESDNKRFGVPINVPTGHPTGNIGDSPRESSVPTRPDPTRPELSPGGESSARPPDPPAPPSASAPMDAFVRSFAAPSSATPDVEQAISETRQAAGGAPYRALSHQDRDAVQRLAEWAALPGVGPARLREALTAFWAAKGTAGRLSWMTDEDPGRWLGSVQPRKGGHVRALPNSAYQTDTTDLDRLVGGGT